MLIGQVNIDSALALAPMAGVTDLAFRAVCRQLGAGYTYTEMVSAKALCFEDKKTIRLLTLAKDEHPAAVQIFGSDPGCIREAAGLAAQLSGADVVDINMGCPTPKIVSGGDGCALMRDPALAEKVIRAAAEGCRVPVSVKIRLGWDKGAKNAVDFARMAEQAGAAAVCVHGRTRGQMYAGHADWEAIAQVRQALTVPVIANGDIVSGADAVRARRITGADMLMIGRGAFGNPWIFEQAAAALEGKPEPPRPPLKERFDLALRQFELAMEDKGERIAVLEARKHYAWYLRGVRHAHIYKNDVFRVESAQDVRQVTKRIQRDLRD